MDAGGRFVYVIYLILTEVLAIYFLFENKKKIYLFVMIDSFARLFVLSDDDCNHFIKTLYFLYLKFLILTFNAGLYLIDETFFNKSINFKTYAFIGWGMHTYFYYFDMRSG